MSKSSLITKALNSYSVVFNREYNLEELYAMVGLKNENRTVWRKSDVQDKLRKNIEDLLNECNIVESEIDKKIRSLMTHYLYSNFKYKKDVSRELQYLYVIHYLKRIDEKNTDEKSKRITIGKMRKLLRYTVWYVCLSDNYGNSIYKHYEDFFPNRLDLQRIL